ALCLKRIIPHAFVPLLRKLLELLSGFRVAFWCTDGYRAYNDDIGLSPSMLKAMKGITLIKKDCRFFTRSERSLLSYGNK
ncbi:MAG: hypothetical protein ACR5LD_00930, partial [Symbiopectobacterium sp.]